MVVSFYALLHVEPTATEQEIRAAFKRRVLAVHPDKGGSNAEFQEAQVAFKSLMSERCRAQHDRNLARTKGRSLQSQTAQQKRKLSESSRTVLGKRVASSRAVLGKRVASSRTRGSSWRAQQRQRVKPSLAWPKASVGTWAQHPLRQLYNLLQKMHPGQRRLVLTQKFSEAQRLELEQWILSRNEKGSKPGPQSPRRPSKLKRPLLSVSVGKETEEEQVQLQKQSTVVLKHHSVTLPNPGLPTESNHDFSNMINIPAQCTRRKRAHSKSTICNLREASSKDRVHACKSRAQVQGIVSHVRRGRVWYSASKQARMIRFVSREVVNLSTALDFLVILKDLRERIVQALDAVVRAEEAEPASSKFETHLRDVVTATLKDHGSEAEKDLDLRFSICVPAQAWIGAELITPWFRVADLEQGLRAWRQLHDARWDGQFGKVPQRLWSIEASQTTWLRIRDAFLRVLEEIGCNRPDTLARLNAREAARKPFRERAVERWNQRAMEREERCQRLALGAEERQRVQRERMAMSHADVVAQRLKQSMTCMQLRLERRVEHWLQRWESALGRSAAQIKFQG